MSVDTLKLYERLRKTELPDAAAKEIAEVIKETSDATALSLATKQDMNILELNLRKEIKELELSLRKEIKELELSLRKEIEVLRKDLDLKIEVLRKDLDLKTEVLRKEIAESKSSVIIWVAGMLIAQAAFIAALVKL